MTSNSDVSSCSIECWNLFLSTALPMEDHYNINCTPGDQEVSEAEEIFCVI